MDNTIANTILEQMKYGNKRTIMVMCWGTHNIVKEERAVKFDVNAHHFQGTVKVSLNYADTYDVELIKDGEVVEKIEGLYFDNFTEIIDERIEKIGEYSF